MYEVEVLKVDDPSCFWCQIIKCNGADLEENKEYEKMFEDLNFLYGRSYRNLEEMKPASLSVGEFCVVFCEELESWCRAVLNAPTCSAEDNLVECFLLDHALYCPVKKKNIRLPVEACQRLPFRAKKFKLHHIQPISMCIDFCGDSAELGPKNRWDSAAIQYFSQLINESTLTEAMVCSVENNSLSVYLYITTKEVKVCVNDDLVVKSFASFCSVLKSSEKVSPINAATSPEVLETCQNYKEVVNPAKMLWPGFYKTNTPHPECPIQEKIGVELRAFSDCNPEATQEREEKCDFAKLLQILNPEPLKLSDEQYNEQKPCFKIQERPILVRKTVQPCSTFEVSPLSSDLKKELIREHYDGPSFTESYCWPSIVQGFDTIVISSDGMKPMNYIPPILTFLHFASAVYRLLPTRNGPVAVIICSGWKKAHKVYELLLKYNKYTRPLNPMLILVGLKKEDCDNISIKKGCEVIVTTPHSLLRYLEHHGLLLLRLCHLVLDEVEQLLSNAGHQLMTILEYCKRTVTAENRQSAPQQIVAIGTYWHRDMEPLLQYVTDPQVIITEMEQAAVYGNVQQVIQLCLEKEKTSVLLRTLDFTPDKTQKVLIFTKSDEEAELVHKTVQNNSVYSLLLNKGLVHSFSHVLKKWKKMFSQGTHVVLVVTDEYVPLMEIRDATCVIHFSFPENQYVFGLRLISLLDYIQNKIERVTSTEQDYSGARSILLMTGKHAHHAVQILHYLQNTTAKIPPELNHLICGIKEAKEDLKSDEDICQYVKTFGYCRKNAFTCPQRHRINPHTDLPSGTFTWPETDQYISVMPLYFADATHFFGRIIAKDNIYNHLVEEMSEFYETQNINSLAQNVEVGNWYALKTESGYCRVQAFYTKTQDGILSVRIKLIDEGRTDEVRGNQLLRLPPKFQNIPPQAVEFIVCRVQPIDGETEWNPVVTRFISKNIKGKLHTAKVVLRLGNTYWLDPMVQVSRLSSLATCINELNVRHEILSTGMGTDNSQHIHHLKELLEKACGSIHTRLNSEDSTSEENVPSIKTTTNNGSVSPPPFLDNKNSDKEGTILEDKLVQHKPFAYKSLHPEVKWFQKNESVILTIKVREFTDHSCTFYTGRVVFSCHAGEKYYLADLELYKEIIKEKSEFLIKNGEPVIILMKACKEPWSNILKHKNPNVSRDFDHWEDTDTEDSSCFPVVSKSLQNKYSIVNDEVESSEYSESDSD